MEEIKIVEPLQVSTKKRYYYIDWLRIIGSINVFLYHLLRIFDAYPYTLKNKETCAFVGIVAFLLHIWNIPLVFFLAGATCKFSLLKRTKLQYFIERFKRLFIPFMVGALVLVPLQRYVEYLNQGKFMGTLAEFIPWYFAQQYLFTNYTFDPLWLLPIGEHLWFLAALFVLSAVGIPVFTYLSKETGKKLIEQLACVVEKPGGIFVFGIALVVIRIMLQPIYPDYSSWCDFTFWFLIMIYGYIMVSDHRFAQSANRNKYLSLLIAIVSITILLICLAFGDFMHWILYPDYSAGAILYYALGGIITWSMLVFFLGIGTEYLDKGHKLLPLLSEAVMPFYVLNFNIMMLIGYYVVEWELPLTVKILLIILFTLSIVYSLSYMIMSGLPWLRPIFGMRSIKKKAYDGNYSKVRSKAVNDCR